MFDYLITITDNRNRNTFFNCFDKRLIAAVFGWLIKRVRYPVSIMSTLSENSGGFGQ